jgi:hypothetical protein
MAIYPSMSLMRSPKTKPQPTPAMKMTPVVRRGGLGTGLAQLAEGGSMSAYDPCITNLTPNSLP